MWNDYPFINVGLRNIRTNLIFRGEAELKTLLAPYVFVTSANPLLVSGSARLRVKTVEA